MLKEFNTKTSFERILSILEDGNETGKYPEGFEDFLNGEALKQFIKLVGKYRTDVFDVEGISSERNSILTKGRPDKLVEPIKVSGQSIAEINKDQVSSMGNGVIDGEIMTSPS